MSQIEVIERGNSDEGGYVTLGCEIAHELAKEYPMHPWIVSFQGGCMVVRHEHINAFAAGTLKREGFGFLLPKDKLGTPKEVVASARLAGGAMLELFGYPRGKWDGERLPECPKDWRPRQEANFA